MHLRVHANEVFHLLKQFLIFFDCESVQLVVPLPPHQVSHPTETKGKARNHNQPDEGDPLNRSEIDVEFSLNGGNGNVDAAKTVDEGITSQADHGQDPDIFSLQQRHQLSIVE